MKCERCGRNIPIRSKVCPNCGKENPNYNPNPENAPQQAAPTQAQNAANKANQAQVPTQNQPAAPKKKSSLKTLVILAIVVIAIIFVMKQCNAGKLKGTWEADDGSAITFSDSKNGYLTLYSPMSGDEIVDFTYTVSGSKVTIKTEQTLFVNSQTVTFKFKVSGNTLTLTEEDTGVVQTFRKK